MEGQPSEDQLRKAAEEILQDEFKRATKDGIPDFNLPLSQLFPDTLSYLSAVVRIERRIGESGIPVEQFRIAYDANVTARQLIEVFALSQTSSKKSA